MVMMQAGPFMSAVFMWMTWERNQEKEHRKWLIWLAFWGICSILKLVRIFKKARRCSAFVDAEVVDTEDIVFQAHRRTGSTTYGHFPIYRYEYDGIEYQEEGVWGYNSKFGLIGAKHKIRINPQNPKEMFYWKRELVLLAVFTISIMLLTFPLFSMVHFYYDPESACLL